MSNKPSLIESGKIWPYAILIATMFIIGASILTIVIAQSRPVSKSDLFMQGYNETDAKFNDIINAQIAFDKKYNIEYLTKKFKMDNTELVYKISSKDSSIVTNALIEVIITRPNIHDYDMNLKEVSFDGENYNFSKVQLAKEGRWNIMAKITVNDDYRYYNLKADTRYDTTFEY
jgi:hypothetical protein